MMSYPGHASGDYLQLSDNHPRPPRTGHHFLEYHPPNSLQLGGRQIVEDFGNAFTYVAPQ